MRKRSFVVVAIVLFWAFMTGWFVLREVIPEAFGHASPGYRGLLSDGVLISDTWMKITIGDRPIGYSHTGIETDEEDALRRYRMINETELDVTIMGQRQQVSVTAEATLDAMAHLQTFLFQMKSGPYRMRVYGKRLEGERFDVRLRTGDSSSQMTIEIPDEAVIYSPMTALQLKQLKPGEQMRLKTFDPLSLKTTDVVIEALRTERIRHRGQDIPATVLSLNTQGIEVLTWVDSEGVILRQETPFGWRLEACDAQEAIGLSAEADDAQDILVDLAVPVTGSIPAAPRRDPIRLRLHGVDAPRGDLESHRQAVEVLEPHRIEIRLQPDTLPAKAPPLDELAGAHAAFRASTPYVQAADPAVSKRAAAIVGDETDSLQAALRIYDWVHTNVRKTPTVSVPSAAAVLDIMEGDCNEHTYLFVALARAAGLPAKIVVGLTYNEGAFYYHAWPAVYVGRWLEMDPTLGQPAVDATHIKLLEGELEDQMKLMTFIGRLRIEVMDD